MIATSQEDGLSCDVSLALYRVEGKVGGRGDAKGDEAGQRGDVLFKLRTSARTLGTARKLVHEGVIAIGHSSVFYA